MSGKVPSIWQNGVKWLKVLAILPYIILVLLVAKHDHHLFRYWNVKSRGHWQGIKLTWRAWVIAVVGWVVLSFAVVAIFLLGRR